MTKTDSSTRPKRVVNTEQTTHQQVTENADKAISETNGCGGLSRTDTAGCDEAKPKLLNKFVMSDPCANAKVTVFGKTYQVWQFVMQTTSDTGFVDITQAEIAGRLKISERAVQKHFAQLKEAGLLERRKNKNGRMKFAVSPEYFWDYKTQIRDNLVRMRKKVQVQKEKAELKARAKAANMSVVEGGKS